MSLEDAAFRAGKYYSDEQVPMGTPAQKHTVQEDYAAGFVDGYLKHETNTLDIRGMLRQAANEARRNYEHNAVAMIEAILEKL